MNCAKPETITTAIYERGVLRLLDPLALPERTRVRVVIQSISEDEERQQTKQVLADTALVTLPQPTATVEPVPQDRLNDIAKLYAVGGLLSELIIAERDSR